ncbi:hypothetical protein BDV93DRAFT_226616 [Ceratobasidium sp. AG-I]|nr:hypothetical protein BDV93DRAFT_226616 [Ceratobasidium sp. AG-I]
MLSSNLQLQSLAISSGSLKPPALESTALRIKLPSLRSLSLSFTGQSVWALGVMQMIDAPAVEHLFLANHCKQERLSKLINYIATGTTEDAVSHLSSTAPNDQPMSYESIYPGLRDLDIQSIDNVELPLLRSLLSAFPTVTRLSFPPEALQLLGGPPWVLPSLNCINSTVAFGISNILRLRIDAGLPIRRVELAKGTIELSSEVWPESVERLEYPVHVSEPDSDDDDDGGTWRIH